MAAAKPRLARGLSALLGENEQSDDDGEKKPLAGSKSLISSSGSESGPRKLPIDKIRRNPDQARKRFDDTQLDELTESIRQQGIIAPILVRPDPEEPGMYMIVAGERRWRAAQKANISMLPVIVRELETREAMELALVENVQRTDLNPIEEAMGYRALMDEFRRTQDAVAKAVGKSRPHVANCLRLLDLPARVRDLVYEGKLTAGHARAIAKAPNCEELAEIIVDQGLSVRDAERLVKRLAEAAEEAEQKRAANRVPAKDQTTLDLEKAVASALGMGVEIRNRGDAGGEVRIRFSQGDELLEIVRRLQTAVSY